MIVSFPMSSSMFESLASQLRMIREDEKDWSRDDLVDKIMELYGESLSVETIKRLENGFPPTARTLVLVISALNELPDAEAAKIFGYLF